VPFCGGQTPSPLRCGGGVPRLTRIIQSLQVARGPLYSTNPATAVGVENNAMARTLDRDSYGQNERMANAFLPSKAQDLNGHGTLRRWEAIFGIVTSYQEPEASRRAAVVAAWQRFLANNAAGGLSSLMSSLLGPVFVGVVTNAPGSSGDVTWWANNPNPHPGPIPTLWYSTRSQISIHVQQPAGYTEAAFLQVVSAAMLELDWLLPAHCTFNWFTVDTGTGLVGFYLDSYENLLRDAFDV